MHQPGVFGPSRFTHIGRHITGLQTLMQCPTDSLRRVALLGSGPVEPFIFSHILASAHPKEQCVIWAVDEDPQMAQFVTSLRDGEGVPLIDLARTCRDDFDQDSPENTNFTQRLEVSIEEAARFGVPNAFSVRYDHLFSSLPRGLEKCLNISDMDAHEFMVRQTEAFNLIYMGLLLTNMRKARSFAGHLDLLREIRRRLTEGGAIGVGASLSPLHGAHLDVIDLATAGFEVGYISLEYIILSNNQYFGDYGIAAFPSSRNDIGVTPRQAALDSWETVSTKLVPNLHGLAAGISEAPRHNQIFVGALPSSGTSWRLWFINQSELQKRIATDRRLWFNFIDALHLHRLRR